MGDHQLVVALLVCHSSKAYSTEHRLPLEESLGWCLAAIYQLPARVNPSWMNSNPRKEGDLQCRRPEGDTCGEPGKMELQALAEACRHPDVGCINLNTKATICAPDPDPIGPVLAHAIVIEL